MKKKCKYQPKKDTILTFSKKFLFKTLFLNIITVVIYKNVGYYLLQYSFIPFEITGVMLIFYLGGRSVQKYDTFLEMRKLWMSLINMSLKTSLIINKIDDKEFLKDFIDRQIAFINILRFQLRRNLVSPITSYNATFLLEIQKKKIEELKNNKFISEHEFNDIIREINELDILKIRFESLKTVLLSSRHGKFITVLVNIFIFLLPFVIVKELNQIIGIDVWLTIPLSLLSSLTFFTVIQIDKQFSKNLFHNILS